MFDSRAKKNILLLDDDLVIRLVLKRILKRFFQNINIYSSSDGVQGLGYIFVLKSDLVIVDSTLPRHNGLDILDYIKTNQNLKKNKTKVIVLGITSNYESILPDNYVYINKKDKFFLRRLIREISLTIREKRNENVLNKLIRIIGRYIVNIADNIKEHKSYVLKIIEEISLSIYLTIFSFLGGNLKDGNKLQGRFDIDSNRKRVYPTITLGIVSIIILLLKIGTFVGTAVTFQEASLTNVYAASITWNGGGTDGTCGGNVGDGNKWSCGANWSGGVAPSVGDSVTFNSTSIKDATIDASFQGTVANLTIASGYTGTITQARSFNINTAFSQATGSFTAANQTFTDNGSFTLSSGTFTGSSGTMSLAGALTISGGTFNANGGTVNFNGSGSLSCNNVTFNLVTLNNTGTTTVNSTCSLPLGNNPTISSAGSITLTGGTLSGTGTLTINNATLTLNVGANVSGFSAASFNGLTVSGAIADFGSYSSFLQGINTLTLSSGTLTLPNGANLKGNLTISGGTFNAASGTINLAGSLTISGTPTFNANGGNINLTNGTATLSCNNMTFSLITFVNTSGLKTVNSNCNLPLGNNPTLSNDVSLNGTLSGTGTLTDAVNGTLTLNAGANLSGFSGYIDNAATNIVGASINFSTYSPVQFNGTFTLSSGSFTAPSGTMHVSSTFTISGGTFNANSGTIDFNGTTATLSCNNSTFNLVTFTHTSGTKTISNSCNLPLGNNPSAGNTGTAIVNNGTLSGSGTLTLNPTFTFNSGSNLSGFSGFNTPSAASLVIAGANLNLSSYNPVDIKGPFTISAGSITAPTGTMSIESNLNITGAGSFNANGGIVNFNGSSATYDCNNTVFNSVNFTNALSSGIKIVDSTCSFPLGNNPDIPSKLTLNGGTLSGSNTLTVDNNLTFNSGAVLSGFNGLVGNSAVTISGANMNFGTYTTMNLNSSLTFSSGTLTAPSGTMNIAGALTISGTSTFNANGGTVTFDGTSTATLSCNNVTFNLVTFTHTLGTKTVSSNCTLPLGNNPMVGNANGFNQTSTVDNQGTLTGSGTFSMPFHNGNLILTNAGILSGFTELSVHNLTISGAISNFGSYTNVDLENTFTMTTGTFTAPSGQMTVGGVFTLTGGTFDANGGVLEVDDSLTISGSPTFIANNGTLDFAGSNATLSCNSVSLYLVSFAGQTGVKTVNSNCTLPLGNNPTVPNGIILNGTINGSGTYTNTIGTLRLNAGSNFSGFSGLNGTSNSLDVFIDENFAAFNPMNLGADLRLDGGTFTAPSGTMDIGGQFQHVNGAAIFNANNGTVNFTGDINVITTHSTDFYNLSKITGTQLQVEAAVTQSIFGTLTLQGSNGNPIQITSRASGTQFNLNIAGNENISYVSITDGNIIESGTLIGGGDITLNTNTTLVGFSGINANNLILNGPDFDFSIFSPASLNDLTISAGALTAPTGTMDISGNFTVNGGSFDANNGTVVLNGMNQSVQGTTFYNLTKTVTSTDTLTITSGNTETIINNLDLEGASGQLLSLRSTTPGTQWNIDAQGSRVLNYLDVQDSNNINVTTMVAEFSADNGNNVNWEFNNPPNVPSNLGPTNYVDGSYGSNNQPTLTFTTNDPNSIDTIKYNIKIDDNSDFSSPLIDYTSALLAQGSQSFIIGQVAGSGTYTIGSQGQTLPSGTYYWEVNDTDNNNTTSTYVSANGGSIAFGITAKPNDPTNLGPTNVISGSFININQPAFNFNLIDPDSGDQVKYEIQIDNNLDFSSPEVDYISNLQSQISGVSTFTVGQALTGGTYTIGSQSQTLTDDNYYWRVKAIDNHGIESNYVNGKELLSNPNIAFKIDTTSPVGSIVINNSDPITTLQNVTLTIAAIDSGSGLKDMIISEDPNFIGASFESYTTSKPWTLTVGSGIKSIYIKFRDNLDNESLIYSDSIDYEPPIAPSPGPTPTPEPQPSPEPQSQLQLQPENSQGSTITITPVSDSQNTNNYDLTITIVDQNGNPVKNATIKIEGLIGEYTTDENGNVIIKNIPGGSQIVAITDQDGIVEKNIEINGTPIKLEVTLAEHFQEMDWKSILLILCPIVLLIAILIYFIEKRKSVKHVNK